ncbi:sulfotransferase family 2 domain-containing protein [Winogradskyella helgolandensis]|uniref:sulfotransferase family 2 domain-containing protein n=1 Tax=Winogradskyella helgolandensis TaxID=2697010 RepID=UPI0015BDADBA|nr:sulfotransferase family 2 domain-containing protein [Winogradskyella helgolandensis]
MILFTHIEKCAGTSFNQILSLTYPRYFHVTKNNFGGNESKNDLKINEFNKIVKFYPSIIGGHSIRPYLRFLNEDKNFDKITFLRNPIDRYMSQYNHDHERGFSPDIDYFIKRSYTENFMVNKLAGENDINKARFYLNQYSFVGDVDNYNQSINALSDVLNVKFYGLNEKKNVRLNNTNYLNFEDLTENQKVLVYDKNKLDIKLYEEFVINSNVISRYPNSYIFKTPSKLRLKITNRLNKEKKIIINKIRE